MNEGAANAAAAPITDARPAARQCRRGGAAAGTACAKGAGFSCKGAEANTA
jgi:hypothetical protein